MALGYDHVATGQPPRAPSTATASTASAAVRTAPRTSRTSSTCSGSVSSRTRSSRSGTSPSTRCARAAASGSHCRQAREHGRVLHPARWAQRVRRRAVRGAAWHDRRRVGHGGRASRGCHGVHGGARPRHWRRGGGAALHRRHRRRDSDPHRRDAPTCCATRWSCATSCSSDVNRRARWSHGARARRAWLPRCPRPPFASTSRSHAPRPARWSLLRRRLARGRRDRRIATNVSHESGAPAAARNASRRATENRSSCAATVLLAAPTTAPPDLGSLVEHERTFFPLRHRAGGRARPAAPGRRRPRAST